MNRFGPAPWSWSTASGFAWSWRVTCAASFVFAVLRMNTADTGSCISSVSPSALQCSNSSGLSTVSVNDVSSRGL